MRIICLSISILLLTVDGASAYVGPGLGIGVIGAILGIILAVFFSVVGVFYYPIKRIIKKYHNTKKKQFKAKSQ